MDNFYSWLYVDYENNIWKFSMNNNKELCYKILSGEKKQTGEGVIDKNVVGFAVYIEKDGKIHIVYSNANGQIKYCTMKENKWYGRTLYLMDSNNFAISNLKIEIIGDEMHIFYLLIDVNASDYGVLIHSIWNGKETKSTKLSDIALIPDVSEKYIISTDKDKNIDLLFISEEEEEETSLTYCSYKNRRWSRMKRLYSIQGHEIAFEMLSDQKWVQILNKHREGDSYYLDHVRFGLNGDLQKFNIYESRLELAEPLLFKSNDRLCACWLEENKICYSVFDGANWGRPAYFNRGNEHKVRRYHFSIASDKETAAPEREIYGTGERELNLYFPSEFVKDERKLPEKETVQAGLEQYGDVETDGKQPAETLQNVKLELYRERSENNRLKVTLASLSAQVQKKQSQIEEYKEKFSKLMEQKKNTDENCDIFIELQQTMQTKLEFANQKLKEEEERRMNTESMLKEEEALRMNTERMLKERETGNTELQQQLEKLIDENKQLLKDLELQKNKSIMERLLKL